MNAKSQHFLVKMLGFLPTTIPFYEESVKRNGEILETVIIEDVFMPEIITLLKSQENTILLNSIFEYFEEVCNSEDYQLIDNFSVTVLEKLGEDKDILEISQKYVRPKTKQLLIETIESM